MDDGGLTMGVGCRHEGRLMGGMVLRGDGVGNHMQEGACSPSPLSLTLSPDGRGNHLWEPRPRGDAAVRAPQTFDRGEGAAPTITPSPSTGDGWGLAASCPLAGLLECVVVSSEGDQRTVASADDGSTPTLALPPQGGGDTCLVSEVVKRSFQQPHVVKQVALTLPTNTPSPLRGEGGGGGEQRTVAIIDAWQCAHTVIAPRAGLPQRHHVIPAPAGIQRIQPAKAITKLSHKPQQKNLNSCAA